MKLFSRLMIGSFLTTSVIASIAYGQNTNSNSNASPTPIPGTNWQSVMDSLFSRAFLEAALVAFVLGAIGGLVYELITLRGNVERPHSPVADEETEKFPFAIVKNMYDLGFFARVLIGAAAALVILPFVPLDSGAKLVAWSLVAGSAGTSVFTSVQNRLLAILAQKEVAAAKEKKKQTDHKIKEAKRKLKEVKGHADTTRLNLFKTVTAVRDLKGDAATDDLSGQVKNMLTAPDLSEVESLLSEAEAINNSI